MRIRSNRIVYLVFRLLFTIFGVAVGRLVLRVFPRLDALPAVLPWVPPKALPILILIIIAIIFFILSKYAYRRLNQLIAFVESETKELPAGDIAWGLLGFIIGLVLAYLVSIPIYRLNIPYVSNVISLLIYGFLGVLGVRLMRDKRAEVAAGVRRLFTQNKDAAKKEDVGESSVSPKILDTSVIIDGRVVDIIDLGFIVEPIIVPTFVLAELQGIADSANGFQRTKGRKGLDALKKLQDDGKQCITILEKSYDDLSEVDDMLLRLAKEINGTIVTNDFNLNKVAAVQGINVLNINALANAMKPVFITGEKIRVFVVKPGSQEKQGLGYLDDGTMIVVENGIDYLGEEIECIVTSMLQTSAGKMIFARPVD
ncbi:MAG: PIN/TRAM domain-containing protein [Peptoniphilus sp.]|nr:PIN domain-containing protein [Peptoniphilus sp.]MDD7362580.1 PIN/TRAM domain-containing protein [Bacillota bacterium]MDY6045021.1 PIN/TRAM domain-containing protein [Peptoniphilus sp.]